MELHGSVSNVILVLNVGCEHVPVNTYSLLLGCGNGKYDDTVARNGVVQLARVELSQTYVHLVLLHIEETVENLDSVGALLVDVVARVSTLQALDRSLHEEVTLRSLLAVECELHRSGLAAGA